MMWGAGFGMGLVGWLWMLGGLILVAALVALVVRALSGPTYPEDRGSARTSALDILRERYARGEITEAELEQSKKALGYRS